jgi:hypothetical protein
MSQSKCKHALHVEPKPGSVKFRQPLHAARLVHDVGMRGWIAEKVCDLIGALTR